MDDLLPLLLSFPPHPPPAQPLSDDAYDGQIRGLLQVLNQIPGSRLTGKVSGGADLLDVGIPECDAFIRNFRKLQDVLNGRG